MTYAIDGEQYVAILVGTGSSWALIGGDTNMKGFVMPNVSRLLVYKLGGTVQLPPAPEMQRPPIDPPPATASADVVARGAPIYETYCGSCHGAGVVGVGLLPDLRRTPFLHSPDGWKQVVIEGARKDRGMASFASVMNEEEAQAVRAYVVLRANQDKAVGGNVPAPAGDR